MTFFVTFLILCCPFSSQLVSLSVLGQHYSMHGFPHCTRPLPEHMAQCSARGERQLYSQCVTEPDCRLASGPSLVQVLSTVLSNSVPTIYKPQG